MYVLITYVVVAATCFIRTAANTLVTNDTVRHQIRQLSSQHH